jgi:hypothetical protein
MTHDDQSSHSIEPHGADSGIAPENAALSNAVPDPTPQHQPVVQSINVTQQHHTFQTDGADKDAAAHLSSEIAVPKDLKEAQIRNEALAEAAADESGSEGSSLPVERVFPIRIQHFGKQSDIKGEQSPESPLHLLTMNQCPQFSAEVIHMTARIKLQHQMQMQIPLWIYQNSKPRHRSLPISRLDP